MISSLVPLRGRRLLWLFAAPKALAVAALSALGARALGPITCHSSKCLHSGSSPSSYLCLSLPLTLASTACRRAHAMHMPCTCHAQTMHRPCTDHAHTMQIACAFFVPGLFGVISKDVLEPLLIGKSTALQPVALMLAIMIWGSVRPCQL